MKKIAIFLAMMFLAVFAFQGCSSTAGSSKESGCKCASVGANCGCSHCSGKTVACACKH